VKIDVKHVHVVKKPLADGTIKEYYYHRRTRKPIAGSPGSAAFQIAYEEASKSGSGGGGGSDDTFSRLIADYIGSYDFQKKSDWTKKDYLKAKRRVEERWGDMPIKLLNDKRIKREFVRWRDLMAKSSPKQADLTFGFARRVVSYAVKHGQLDVNHLKGLGNAYEADRSDKVWTVDQVNSLMKRANPYERMAILLALHTGRRLGDLITVTWGDWDGEFIKLLNSKGGKRIKIAHRATKNLALSIEKWKRALGRVPHQDDPILITPKGLPWNAVYLSSVMGDLKKECGFDDLHFHDMRGTAITVLSENGCTTPEIASISGHSMKQVEAILEKYMARTRPLNDAAVAKLEQSWIASLAL
jgi:integrase